MIAAVLATRATGGPGGRSPASAARTMLLTCFIGQVQSPPDVWSRFRARVRDRGMPSTRSTKISKIPQQGLHEDDQDTLLDRRRFVWRLCKMRFFVSRGRYPAR